MFLFMALYRLHGITHLNGEKPENNRLKSGLIGRGYVDSQEGRNHLSNEKTMVFRFFRVYRGLYHPVIWGL